MATVGTSASDAGACLHALPALVGTEHPRPFREFGKVRQRPRAGQIVAPRIFAYVVAAWLFLIIANLLMIPGYFDVALRDLGLALGALALGRLSQQYSD